MSSKRRLDELLVARGLSENRDRAAAQIMAGLVFVDGERVDKAGTPVAEKASLEVRTQGGRYASRGGLKLEKALDVFALTLQDAVCIDMGASTGGFTDCMLQHGARRVYAIDVGYGQLAYELRRDPRVTVLERTNIRTMDTARIPEAADFISIDVSFISLALILPKAAALLQPQGKIAALVKPQFEARREQVGSGGIVRDPAVHREVLARTVAAAAEQGLQAAALTYSPVTGARGNIEYLLLLQRQDAGFDPVEAVPAVTAAAMRQLGTGEDADSPGAG
ncbi:MAG: TlyA family RNA methyltransferase [Anaerovoracaceae bacterium]|jgi:23S rRNA (cytidine1920-2'-O)/16S rRNA (cytidine1409-2'-O)-methyltransferase